MRYAPIILFGLFIDGFSAILTLSLSGITVGAGTLLQFIPVVGNIFGTALWGMGLALGFGLTVAINIAFGVALLFIMLFNDTLYAKRLWASGMELVPGLNFLPFWTLFTIACSYEHAKENGTLPQFMKAASRAVVPTQKILSMKQQAALNVQSPNATPAYIPNIPQPQTTEELVDFAARQNDRQSSRVPLINRDIRPATPNPHVQTA